MSEIDTEPNAIVARAAGGNSNGTGKGMSGETPVANINYRIYRPFPSTNQVLMVYNNRGSGVVDITSGNTVQQLTFRLNAINDVETPYNYTIDPNATNADAITGTPSVPSMRNFWSTVYQYYTVVRSRYHFRIRPANASAITVGELDIYQHKHGIQFPPLVMDTDQAIPWNYRKYFPNTDVQKMKSHPQGSASTQHHYLNQWTEFYGQWYPGSIKHQVEEDENRKTWIKMTDIPRTPEYLSYVLQRSSSSSATAINYQWEFNIEFEVQLKELRTQYEYIRPKITLSLDPVNLTGYTPVEADIYNQNVLLGVP